MRELVALLASGTEAKLRLDELETIKFNFSWCEIEELENSRVIWNELKAFECLWAARTYSPIINRDIEMRKNIDESCSEIVVQPGATPLLKRNIAIT